MNPTQKKDRGIRWWIPAMVGCGGLLSTLILWHALVVHERSQVQRELAIEAHKVRAQIFSELQARILALVRLSRGWEVKGQPDAITWDFDVRLLVHHYSGLRSIAWVDPDLVIRWMSPEDPLNRRLRGMSIA